MTLTRRLVIMVASCIAFAILVVSIVFGLLGRNALIAQAEGQAQVVARIIAESARLSEVAMEEAQEVVTDVLTTLALTADHVEQVSIPDVSDRFAEIVARGNLDSIWLVDSDLKVLASSVGNYGPVINGQSLPDRLSRDAVRGLVTGRKFSVDFGPALDGVRYVGVRAGPGQALIVGQPVRALDAVKAANSVPVLLEALLNRNDIISIEVMDDQLKSFAQVGATKTPEDLLGLAASAISTGQPDSELKERHLWVSAPIRDTAGIVIGAVVIQLSNQRLDRLLSDIIVYGVGSAALVFAFGASIAAISARRIARPVLAMTSAAREIEQRSFLPASLDPLSRRKDEIGTLARVFQDMAVKVERRAEDLEAEVKARTLELEQKNALLEESALRVEAELQAAKTLQAAMLPEVLPANARYAGKASMVPAREMGGDFYDFFLLDERRLGLVIADVSGKGVPAAFFMAISRTVLQSSALDGGTTGDCLARANEALCARNPMEMFVTAFYAVLDIETGDLAYSNGGHNPPLMVRRADGTVAELPRTGGMALGVMPDLAYDEKFARLDPGDTLFLYTDGITEAMDRDGHEFTEARLERSLEATVLQPVEVVLSEVTRAVNAFVAGAPQSDDITCLVVRYLGPEGLTPPPSA